MFEETKTIDELDEAHSKVRKEIRNEYSIAKRRIKGKLDKETAMKVRDWREGETIYFTWMSKGGLSLSSSIMYDSVDADHAEFYHYQPKKKLVWLKFAKIKNPTYPGGYLPFTLGEVRRWKMGRTDVKRG